jgi:calcium/calmodulin-dependent protein kinase I
MEDSPSYFDSSLYDASSPLADTNIETERKRSIQTLRKKLKLQHVGSSKACFFSGQEDSNHENSDNTEKNSLLKNLILKKKFLDLYTPLEIIGQGSCGVVKTVLNIEEDKIYVAKIVRARDQEHLEQIKRENQILSKLDHKNIIKVKELLMDESIGHAQLILEYFPSKTLEELIHENGTLQEDKVKLIIEQVVSALKLIHDKGVCHRDLSASNILVNENYEVRVIDFSVSKILRKDLWSPRDKISASLRKKSTILLPRNNFYMLSNTGTDYYKAPEVVSGVPYNQSVDMWSLGVIIFYCLAGKLPFQSKNLEKLYNKITKGVCKWDPIIWEHISYEVFLFVKACLNKVPFIRLSTKEALYHPWIRGITLDGLETKNLSEVKRGSKHFTFLVRREKSMESSKLVGKSLVFDLKPIDKGN